MPIDKEKISAQAQKYFQKGQYDKAIKEYQKIIEADPSDMRIWKKIGDVQVKAGKTREAIATYLKLADSFFAQGFYSKALALLRQIQTMDASIEEVYLKLADVYVASNFLPDAIHQLDRLSKLQESAGNVEAMLATLRRMADLDPQSWTYRAHLAETLSRLGRKAEAAVELRKVSTQLQKDGNLTDFIRVAERLMFHDPDDVENVKNLADAYLQTRAGEEKLKQVLKVLLKFLQGSPSDEGLLQLLARMFLALSKQESAVNVYRELARIYREQGRIAESEAVLEKILAILPQDEETLIALGRKKAPPPPEKRPTSARRGGRDYSEPVEEISLEELEVIEEEEGAQEESPALVGEDLKKLEEATAFFQFSLFDQVLEIIEKIRARDALPVLELEKNVYMRLGRKEKALEIMERLATAWERSNPEKAAEIAQEILLVDPSSALAGRILQKSPGEGARGREDDLFNILQEIEAIETELPAPAPDAGLEDLFLPMNTGLHSEEEVQRELRQLEISRGTGVHEIPDDELDLASMLEAFKDMDANPVAEGDDYETMPSQVSDLPFGDLVMQGKLDELDELEAFKEASQSFIRIRELSQEEIRLTELEAPPVMEKPARNAGMAAEEDPFDFLPPPSAGDFFQLGADEPTPVRPEPAPLREPSPESAGGFEPTLDHVRELLMLGDRIASEFAGDSVADEKEPEVPAQPPPELVEAFAEVDFFLDQELFDEAIDMLNELRERHPIEFLRDKMTAVYKAAGRESELASILPEAVEAPAAAGEPDPFETPFGAEPPDLKFEGPLSATASSPGEENFSLDFDEEVVTNLSGLALENLGHSPEPPVAASEPAHGVRVESQIPDGDATFFDLGVAYKEMGLHDQAIAQFRLAMQEPRLAIKSHMMIAQCLMEMGKFSEAASEYKKTLHVQDITKDEEMDLYFELGQLYERLQDTPEALYFYRKVLAWNPRYRNVSQIVERLQ